jgi:hypothetical protein
VSCYQAINHAARGTVLLLLLLSAQVSPCAVSPAVCSSSSSRAVGVHPQYCMPCGTHHTRGALLLLPRAFVVGNSLCFVRQLLAFVLLLLPLLEELGLLQGKGASCPQHPTQAGTFDR